jgi:elongator complex protein 1
LLAGKHSKALKAYEKAHAWRELFSLALEQKVSDEVLSSLIERVSGACLP